MKKLLLFMFAVLAFAACEQAPIEEMQGVAISDRSLEVSFECADDTRIQLQGGKTVWTEGDHVSVFYRSTTNEEWQFMGETGDRTGQIVPVDNSVNPPATHNRVVVIYPYNKEYYLNTETYSIEASLPAVQNYLNDSYGTNGNIMVSSNDYKQVSLKSVCGWLKLQLTGDGEVVKSITLRGNNGEQVAGELHINTSDATCVLASASGDAGESEVGGTLVRPGTILTEVTLDCGEGVTLGKNATAFYIALPPQTFEKGIKIEILCADDTKMVKSSNKALSIERNHIQPMTAIEFTPSVPNNQIWYTSYYGDIVEPNNTNVFGANIVSNTYTNGKGVITFDGDVTTIGDETFVSCYSLTSVNIPDSVTTIGRYAFADCNSLTSVNIGNSVTTIGESAFADCNSLTSVTIGDSVTTIGNYAFYSCESLTSVNIPDSVTTIGNGAFRYCTSLTSVNIPDSVTTIGEWAFWSCTNLTSVNIGDSVTTIGNYAFASCTSLTSVTIGNSVTTIGEGAFYDCDSLTEFTGKFAEDNGRILVVDGVLTAFAPAGITEYSIPDGVTSIGYAAFASCDSLTSVTIPDIVTTIGDYAFYYCTSLTTVNIPDSVTTIGNYAFYYCTSLTSVNIPDSVTEIGNQAFYYCRSLTSVYCKATTPPALGWDVFDYNASGRKIYVLHNSVEPYKSATYWNEYSSAIVGYDFEKDEIDIPNNEIWYTSSYGEIITPSDPNVFGAIITSNTYTDGKGVITFDGNVTTIGNAAFVWCESLTSVTIPDSVTTIGEDAFYYCYSLTSVNIGDGVTTIGEYAFSGCDSLTSVTISDSVTTIGSGAFSDCSSLTSITIPDSVTTIGEYAFHDCISLTSVTIPDSVTTIGNAAFYHCESMTSVTICDGVTTIGEYAFHGCYCLTSITIPDSVTSIGNSAFEDCDSLTSVTIGDSVTSIGDSAFNNCISLTSVTIGDDVTTIGSGAFSDCDSLTSITIPDSVTTIGDGAFFYCTSLTTVNIPDSVTTIGGSAFDSCTSLTSVTIGDSVTEIGEGAFEDCDSLTEFNGKFASKDGRCLIVDGVLNSFAPYGLTEYTIPDSVTSIGNSAFEDCDSLTSVTIPDSVTTIGEGAFEDCDSLTSITIPNSVTTIGEYAFYDCYGLTSITIPDSVTTIGEEAFCECDSLTSVTIGDGVTTIGYDAFAYCTSLTSVYCKATTPPSLDGSWVFDDNLRGRKIYVPTGSVNAYKSDWKWYASIIVGYDF